MSDQKEPKSARKRQLRRLTTVDKKKLKRQGLTMIQRQMMMLMDKSGTQEFTKVQTEQLINYMKLLEDFIEQEELEKLEGHG